MCCSLTEFVPQLTGDSLIFSIFFLCVSLWIVSVAVSSSWPIFSSSLSNLLLISSNIFYFRNCICISDSLILVFFIFSLSLITCAIFLEQWTWDTAAIIIPISLSDNPNDCIISGFIFISWFFSSHYGSDFPNILPARHSEFYLLGAG